MSQVPSGSDWEYVDVDETTTGPDAYTAATQPGASSRGEMAPYQGQTPDEAQRLAEKEEKLIRRRARKKVLARNALKTHLSVYAAVMALLWGIWLVSDSDELWPLIPMLGWGIGVVSHIVNTRQMLSKDDEIEDEVRKLRRQIGR